ncbi:MAG TPA: wax ester/triacylglycerol synthase domain-containing protein [Streptosporangiaceae bacterium]
MTAATGRSLWPGPPVIERASPTDRAFLAMDTGEVPEQFGVILLLDPAGGFDLAEARRLIAERVPAVPRLRQRLTRAPFGGGGPIWVDDPRFDIAGHVRAVACPKPGNEQALLDYALSVVMTPLRRAAPLWSATFVTGLADGAVALVVVLHHALADGVGGLTVLARLTDAPAAVPPARRAGFPRPAPSAAMLVRDAWAGGLRALRNAAQSWRLLRASTGAGGGLRPRAPPPVR